MIKLTGNKVYPLSSSYHTLELPPSLLEYASPLLPPFELAPTLLPDFSSLFSIPFLLLFDEADCFIFDIIHVVRYFSFINLNSSFSLYSIFIFTNIYVVLYNFS